VWCDVQLPTLLVVSQVPWLQSNCGGLINCGKMARRFGWLVGYLIESGMKAIV